MATSVTARLSSSMNYYFIGRVGKIKLSPTNALQPIFEAVVNSINAIRDARISNGRIDVSLKRALHPQKNLSGLFELTPIENVEIRDNGIGFTENNYYSFCTPDFSYKRAALGVGRLLWLITFRETTVESRFDENGKRYVRTFDFKLTEKGVENPNLKEADLGAPRETIIKLRGFLPRYQSACEKQLQTIADKLIEHCLFYLSRKDCPVIVISDDAPDSEPINLNYLYENSVREKPKPKKFTVKGVPFSISHFQLKAGGEKKHKMHFCANERPVRHLPDLSKYIPDLGNKPILDDAGAFKYAAYVSSDYLTERVDQERTGFDFEKVPDEDQPNLQGESLSLDDIKKEAVQQARRFLEPYLLPAREEKIAYIKNWVAEKAPQYRVILKARPEVLERFKSNPTDAELDAGLRQALFEIETELQRNAKEVIRQTPDNLSDIEEYKSKFRALVNTANEVSNAQLAYYVIHRKLILDLLHSALGIKDGGEYSKEDRIHQMIYPMGTTSDEVPYEQQNLWIIDERLNYHQFLGSNKQLRSAPKLETKSQDRPDIVVFGGDSDVTHSSVALVEFKRPMRDDLGSEDNDPVKQLLRYTELIRKGLLLDDEGRRIPTNPATRFYCYLICDINEQIRYHAGANELVPAPDLMAYFGYKQFFKSYIEVIDYTKLIADARKRNQTFIAKLCLPLSE
jgi:hypothetical protein